MTIQKIYQQEGNRCLKQIDHIKHLKYSRVDDYLENERNREWQINLLTSRYERIFTTDEGWREFKRRYWKEN